MYYLTSISKKNYRAKYFGKLSGLIFAKKKGTGLASTSRLT